jgi:hypothetical protein
LLVDAGRADAKLVLCMNIVSEQIADAVQVVLGGLRPAASIARDSTRLQEWTGADQANSTGNDTPKVSHLRTLQ